MKYLMILAVMVLGLCVKVQARETMYIPTVPVISEQFYTVEISTGIKTSTDSYKYVIEFKILGKPVKIETFTENYKIEIKALTPEEKKHEIQSRKWIEEWRKTHAN